MSDFIWVEKYRPKTIEECILPNNTKKTFQSFLDKGWADKHKKKQALPPPQEKHGKPIILLKP